MKYKLIMENWKNYLLVENFSKSDSNQLYQEVQKMRSLGEQLRDASPLEDLSQIPINININKIFDTLDKATILFSQEKMRYQVGNFVAKEAIKNNPMILKRFKARTPELTRSAARSGITGAIAKFLENWPDESIHPEAEHQNPNYPLKVLYELEKGKITSEMGEELIHAADLISLGNPSSVLATPRGESEIRDYFSTDPVNQNQQKGMVILRDYFISQPGGVFNIFEML